jgi:hypothetical protein
MKAEVLFFHIPQEVRVRLEYEARKYKVTMSWIVRSLVDTYRSSGYPMPCSKRPRRLLAEHVRFGLILHGNKSELMAYARLNGGEAGPFLRYLLELWLSGELIPDLDSVATVKSVKKCVFSMDGIASDIHIDANWYKPHEFREKNPKRNLWWMERGLRRKRKTY